MGPGSPDTPWIGAGRTTRGVTDESGQPRPLSTVSSSGPGQPSPGSRPSFNGLSAVSPAGALGSTVHRSLLRGARDFLLCFTWRVRRSFPPKSNREGAVASIRTTMVGRSTRSSPYSSTEIFPAPYLRREAPASLISSRIDDPFIATSSPPWRTSGIDQPSSRSSGATARDVTTEKSLLPWSSSARARTTSTLPSASSVTASSRKVDRRSNGSTRVTRRSGRAMARTSPGSPAPEPMSHTSRSGPMARPSSAQLIRCRSQSLGTSRGPINPRRTPSRVRIPANCSADGRVCENTPTAASGARGVSRETGSFTRTRLPS